MTTARSAGAGAGRLQLTRRRAYGVATIIFLAVMAGVATLSHLLPKGQHLAALPYAAAAVGAAALASCVLHWRSLDEAAKEAHKVSWYWGGSVGLLAAGGLMVFVSANRDLPLREFALFPGDAGLFVTGALAAMTAQLIGYAVAWAGWWLTKR